MRKCKKNAWKEAEDQEKREKNTKEGDDIE